MLEFVQAKTRARVWIDPRQIALVVEKERMGAEGEQPTVALLLHSGICVQVMDLDRDAGARIAAARGT